MKTMMYILRTKTIVLIAIAGILTVFSSCDKDDDYDYNPPIVPLPLVFKSSGDSLGIVGTINQFRTVLGDSLNTTPGKTSGRREVNWDGVPANLTNNNLFPFDFFNNTDVGGPNGRKRGLQYLETGSPLRLDSSNFAEIDAAHGNEFIPFSKKKSIVSANSNVSEIGFRIAGTTTNAFVKGFGIIFSDVDDANSTSIECFNGNQSLGIFKAPVKIAGAPFSFLGVYFNDQKITRVKIIAGNNAIVTGVKDLSDGGLKDLVAYDDLFYDEPKQL